MNSCLWLVKNKRFSLYDILKIFPSDHQDLVKRDDMGLHSLYGSLFCLLQHEEGNAYRLVEAQKIIQFGQRKQQDVVVYVPSFGFQIDPYLIDHGVSYPVSRTACFLRSYER